MFKEFTIDINEDQLTNIKSKIEHYPWSSIENMEEWTHGTNKKYLKELCDYWLKEFSWKKHEQLINSFKNYKTNVDGIDIHFIKEECSGENPKTLLLLHGWPGSVVEFLEIIIAEDLDNSKERSKIGITTSSSFCNLDTKFIKPITSKVSGDPFFKRRFLSFKI